MAGELTEIGPRLAPHPTVVPSRRVDSRRYFFASKFLLERLAPGTDIV